MRVRNRELFNLVLAGLVAAAAFASVTFYVPAGFLRVSRTNRLLSAFSVASNLQLIARVPMRYAEAWIG